MLRALLALLAFGLLLAPAAQAAGSPETRADAQRLALLNLRFEKRVQAPLEAIEAEFDKRLSECSTGPADAPDPASDDVIMRQVALYIREAAVRIGPQIDRLNARLDAFRTRDFRLRRTARSMAAANRKLQELSVSPVDACAYFEQWKAAGWASSFRIQPPVRNFSATEVRGLRRHTRIIRSGIRHMGRLGVSRGRTQRLLEGWESDTLYDQLFL
jgi:hypothetical protein